MPTSRMTRDAGFTLVEILVVLAIMSLVVAIAVPRLGSTSVAARDRLYVGLASRIADARAVAIQSGRVSEITADDLGHIDDKLRFTPDGGAPAKLLFHPDGSATSGTVTFEDRPFARVNWINGAVAHDR